MRRPRRGRKIIEWKIEQKHYLRGDNIIYATPFAIKIVNETLGCEVVSKAPDWSVHAFYMVQEFRPFPASKAEYNGRANVIETLRIKEVPYKPRDFDFPSTF